MECDPGLPAWRTSSWGSWAGMFYLWQCKGMAERLSAPSPMEAAAKTRGNTGTLKSSWSDVIRRGGHLWLITLALFFTVCHSMFALQLADSSIRSLWNHTQWHSTCRSICFPWCDWFFPHPQTWSSISVLLFWHLDYQITQYRAGRRSRRGTTLSRTALHCSHTLTPTLQKCTRCRAEESLSKMKICVQV